MASEFAAMHTMFVEIDYAKFVFQSKSWKKNVSNLSIFFLLAATVVSMEAISSDVVWRNLPGIPT